MKKEKRLYLVDGSSYIYRAFYALTTLTNSKGEPTNAVFGFARMLLTLLKKEAPEYIAIAFDSRGKTFRHEIYEEYKANRPGMPDDLVLQIPHIKTFVTSLNMKSFSIEGVEADDIIGTLASRAEKEGFQVTIVSGDKDFMQLVSQDVQMLDTMKNKISGTEEVKEKFGVEPEKVVEVMGLTGDTSDNIPGVPGIGIKTAVKLIVEYGDIENVIRSAPRISQKRVREKIVENSNILRLSRELVKIRIDVAVETRLADLRRVEFDPERLRLFLEEMEFHSLIKELKLSQGKANVSAPARACKYLLLDSKKTLALMLKDIANGRGFAIKIFETAGGRGLYALSITAEQGTAYLLLSQEGKSDELIESVHSLMEDPGVAKYGHGMKPVLKFFKKRGVKVRGALFDTMIASYLLRPTLRVHALPELARTYLARDFVDSPGITEKEALSRDDIDRLCAYSDSIFSLSEKLSSVLKSEGLYALFRDIEMPVLEVISLMEDNGVFIDPEALLTLSERLKKELARNERDIFVYAGEKFNINSPKQLAQILFDKLNLKATKKTKTGFSTDNSVLESLSGTHPLPGKVVEYRQIMKIKSTYADALPKMINPVTGRVHTSYNQTVTATGRLSSSEPNLQNIPVRSSLGNEIRRAFVAKDGRVLLSADYSQVELRILAHLSGDSALIDAFVQGEDIHQRSAAEIFHVIPALVTPDMRRMAKTINFGIIYGMGAHGLAKSLGRTRKEAALFLEKYFERYSRVKEFINKSVSDARDAGYVQTLFSRRRSIPDLNSSNRNLREFAERIAVNTRIQGTAADILKVAMVNISRRFELKGLESRMIMQVHDELVFEVLQSELTDIREIVQMEMEGVITLSVPLTVDISTGTNWDKDSEA